MLGECCLLLHQGTLQSYEMISTGLSVSLSVSIIIQKTIYIMAVLT